MFAVLLVACMLQQRGLYILDFSHQHHSCIARIEEQSIHNGRLTNNTFTIVLKLPILVINHARVMHPAL